jgi:hypothetical protein
MTLTYTELHAAVALGNLRTLESIFRGRQRRKHLDDRDAFGDDARGAASEYAVSKHTGLHWPLTVRRFGSDADVGQNVHVRGSRRLDAHLIVRTRDFVSGTKLVPNEPFVLVVGPYPKLILVGWALGHVVQQDKHFYEPDRDKEEQSWWMEQEALSPMATLGDAAF